MLIDRWETEDQADNMRKGGAAILILWLDRWTVGQASEATSSRHRCVLQQQGGGSG